MLGAFVLKEGMETAQGQYQSELDELLSARRQEDQAAVAERIEALAADPANHPEIRQLACAAVPVLAEVSPDLGFPLWQRLASSEDPLLHKGVRRGLVVSLGTLPLHAARVVQVISAYNEVEGRVGPEVPEDS